MAEHKEESESVVESMMEKISDKIHGHDDSSSSSDSDDEKSKASEAMKEMKKKVYRLFGRETPVHSCLGGGKPADLILWRNKKLSASVLGGATLVWILFEVLEYRLLTLMAHCFIMILAGLYIYSKALTFVHKSTPNIPEVSIPEDLTVKIARSSSYEINNAFAVLRQIGLGHDLKKFLMVLGGLWFVSILGSSCSFLTLFYILFVLLYTLPVLYEKYEDKVDAYAEKASIEAKKYYVIANEKYLSKIPKGPLKEKKFD
ncbi:Reticulon-like protein [Rhynchospora pubera]|uniref:Reticulon-like protein n=1 Tax=Rhynchospora pubera TaxID=906938 RepID=A0AAV8F5L2_9POAL|nr:Reticulon-like protein [Rhynchospora pubera]